MHTYGGILKLRGQREGRRHRSIRRAVGYLLRATYMSPHRPKDNAKLIVFSVGINLRPGLESQFCRCYRINAVNIV